MKYVGIKQVSKAVKNQEVSKVYIGKDADKELVTDLINFCKEKSIEVIYVENMKKLGELAKIEVKAAVAAE